MSVLLVLPGISIITQELKFAAGIGPRFGAQLSVLSINAFNADVTFAPKWRLTSPVSLVIEADPPCIDFGLLIGPQNWSTGELADTRVGLFLQPSSPASTCDIEVQVEANLDITLAMLLGDSAKIWSKLGPCEAMCSLSCLALLT